MEYWNRMGGPHGISFIAWLVLAPISILFTIEVVPEGYSPGYSQLTGYLIGFLGHVITGAVLLLGKVTIFRGVGQKPLPVLMLFWFAIAGVVRGASVAWMFDNWGITQAADYFERMRSGAVLVLVWFAVSAVMVDGLKNYRASFLDLSSQLEQQQTLRAAGYRQLKERVDSLVEQIRETLAEALRVGSSSSDMHRAVDQLVRPLAHDMDQRSSVTPKSQTQIRRRLGLGPVLRTALYQTPYNPGWTTLMAVFGTLSSRIWQSGFLAVLDSLAMGFVIWAVFRLARKLKLFGFWVPLVWFLTGVLTAMVGVWITTGIFEYSQIVVYLSVNTFAPAMIVSLIGAFDRNAASNLDRLRSVLSEVTWEIAALDQRAWVEQRRLARFVHSELQSRIRAFALRMDLAARMPTDSEIASLKQECEAALALGNEQRELALFVQDITALWEGLMQIEFDADSEVSLALESDPYATAAAIEICREAIGNAAKHGKATRVKVKLDLLSGPMGLVEISVTNNGVAVAEASSGFGLRVIQDLAQTWSLSTKEHLTSLKATIPIHLQGKN